MLDYVVTKVIKNQFSNYLFNSLIKTKWLIYHKIKELNDLRLKIRIFDIFVHKIKLLKGTTTPMAHIDPVFNIRFLENMG